MSRLPGKITDPSPVSNELVQVLSVCWWLAVETMEDCVRGSDRRRRRPPALFRSLSTSVPVDADERMITLLCLLLGL